MDRTVEEIARKMDALGLWPKVGPFNWAVKPRGTVFPYFCSVLKGECSPIKVRFLMLEGWQTFHDYVRTRVDRSFGYYLSPMEMPHLELVVLENGDARIFRHDVGYMPREANESERALASRILWEAYGVMLRIESDGKLPLRFADEQAMFSRVEVRPGMWEDAPLTIPTPPVCAERIAFDKGDLNRAKDVPLRTDLSVEMDLQLLTGVMTKDVRPKCVYELLGVDAATGEEFVRKRASVVPEGGLKGLWLGLPSAVLKSFVEHGVVPGELRLRSPRVFRLLRPLCLELPLKLSLHDRLPRLERA